MTETSDGSAPAPDALTCRRCLRVCEARDLDRVLWCGACQAASYRRATLRGWAFGAGLTLVLALYIWFGVRPDLTLIPAAWAATLLVAFYLGARVAREIFYGIDRIHGRPVPGAIASSGPSGVEPRDRG